MSSESERQIVLEAMENAKEEFKRTLMKDYDYDSSYFDLDLKAYRVSNGSFLPDWDLELEAEWKEKHRYKEKKVEHWELEDRSEGIDDMYA